MIREVFNPDLAKGAPEFRHDGIDPAIEALAQKVIGAAIEVHKALGPGYGESIYENALSIELAQRGIAHSRQFCFDVIYKGQMVGEGRIDLFPEDRLVVELKAVEKLTSIHESQVVSYLKANNKRLGLLINFNVTRLVDGLQRIVL